LRAIGDRPFQAVEGKWIGAKIGLFCRALDAGATTGHAEFDYFRFAPPLPPPAKAPAAE
jgi:hypothetical protein